MKVKCPFHGEDELERLEIKNKIGIIFPCNFTPIIEKLSDEIIQLSLNKWKETHGDYKKWCQSGHLTSLGKDQNFVNIVTDKNLL